MTAHRLHSATALPLKAEALRPLAMMAGVFLHSNASVTII